MAPAFGPSEAKALLPYFMDAATKVLEFGFYLTLEANSGPPRQMADKWIGIIENDESGHSATIDVNMWIGKATLDAYVLVLMLDVRWLWINHEPFSKESVQEPSTTILAPWTMWATHLLDLTPT